MEVRTCASTGISTESYHFAGSYVLILFYELCRKVTVDSLQSVVVTNNDVFAISASLISYDTYFS